MVHSIERVKYPRSRWSERRRFVEQRERATPVIEIPQEVRDAMVEHAVRELPNEACGLLAGVARGGPADVSVENFYPMANEDKSPLTYSLNQKEHERVVDEIDRKGWDLVGVFHSHTHTRAYPSPTDVERSQGPRVFYPNANFVLVSLADRARPDLRAYIIADRGIEEQEVVVR
jgi:proteasome lid subunit RPN8/RPN11